jgi:hypothetical protein
MVKILAKITARFITPIHLSWLPTIPQLLTHAHAKLPFFIACGLHRTKLPFIPPRLRVLKRLKARFPSTRGSSGHRLFISSFMILCKAMCDDSYSNKSWSVVAQGMFNLREINQMEREMCNYLEWEVTAVNPILSNLRSKIVSLLVTHITATRWIQALSPSSFWVRWTTLCAMCSIAYLATSMVGLSKTLGGMIPLPVKTWLIYICDSCS